MIMIKEIPGMPRCYACSNGQILTHRGRGLTNGTVSADGYLTVGINGKQYRVHRLIAQTFIPNPENKPSVNHIDGVKSNNRVDNLEWATNSENMKHAYATGLMECKLTDKQKIGMCLFYKKGLASIWQLSKMYHVSTETVQGIVDAP